MKLVRAAPAKSTNNAADWASSKRIIMKINIILKTIKTAYKETCYVRKALKESNSGMTNIIKYEEAGFYQREHHSTNPSFLKIFKNKMRDLLIIKN